MAIESREVGNATILLLSGDMDARSGAKLWDIAADLFAAGRSLLVLDLSGVEHLYSTGMCLLLDLQHLATQTGGRVVCCGARPFIREIMRITLLDRTLGMQMDLETALDNIREAS